MERHRRILRQGNVRLLILMLEGLGYGLLDDVIYVRYYCKESAASIFRVNTAVFSSTLVNRLRVIVLHKKTEGVSWRVASLTRNF